MIYDGIAIDLETQSGQITIPMVFGDRLFIYTDGIIDTPNPEAENFGLVRLKDVLDANTEASISKLKSAVLRTFNQYAQKELTHDDVTLIALEIC
ncbi:MAG TPA: SpoIIE family protein phosphatase [Balneolales bacterium]|nr:serine/threonine-protein phosphatase [Desulfobacteraceae bacterium]MDH3839226.1 serine/threonine-protein phosphatase [Desulfobacteraceae bacterium]HKJ32616.1 SpoIIE family protein phosphatase [Balneolales bacterium]